MQKLLGNFKEGLIFVVSAPAGTGKTTLVRMLCDEFDCVHESVSFTTRPARANEVPGKDYNYISSAEFQKMIAHKDFLEYAQVFDHYYGTGRSYVDALRRQSKHVVLVIDTQGALQLMEQIKAVFIFIRPPSIAELRRRLESRKSDSTDSIEQRLSWAEKEISMADRYDYQIVNDHLKTAYDVLRSICIAEEHRNQK
ncbi:MAG: gmk [Parachlamydiales bacterium]|nr:gmk [Parachlamydiales bacterium]